jgi:hypothetical protein
MCIDGWKRRRFNPAGMSVVTREYRDLNESLAVLRSVTSVDHVDIMGNYELIADLLYIASIRVHKSDHPAGRPGERREAGTDRDPAQPLSGSKPVLAGIDVNAGTDVTKRGSVSADEVEAKDESELDVATDLPSGGIDRRLASDVAQEQWQQRQDQRLRAQGRMDAHDDGVPTEEHATWKTAERERRFNEQPTGDQARDKGEQGEQDEEDDVAAMLREGGHAAAASLHPEGELTWSEVGERVYSRIRPIAQRVRQRWEARSGHKLEEADKPPPLSEAHLHPPPRVAKQQQHVQRMREQKEGQPMPSVVDEAWLKDLPLKEGSPHESARRTESGADDGTPDRRRASLRWEWTEEDERQLHRLLALKERARQQAESKEPAQESSSSAGPSSDATSASSAAPSPPSVPGVVPPASPLTASLSHSERVKRAHEEALEHELAVRAEERSAQEEQALQNSRRDHAGDERRKRAAQVAAEGDSKGHK